MCSYESAAACPEQKLVAELASMTEHYRHENLEHLEQALERCIHAPQPTIHSVFISGAAGCGKSSLLDAFLHKARQKAFVCRGKFDNSATSAAEPLAAILSVLESLVECLVVSETPEVWKERVKGALGPDLDQMQQRIPAIRYLVDKERRRSGFAMMLDVDLDSDGYVTHERDWGLERFRLACRALLRVVSRFHPVVLVLDELQCVERDSFEILRTWLLLQRDTAATSRLLIVATHQPVPRTNVVYKLKALVEPVTKLALEKFQSEHVGEIVARVFGVTDKTEVLPLVSFCSDFTDGNYLQLAHLFRYFQKKQMFYFDNSTQRFMWDKKLLELPALQTVKTEPDRALKVQLDELDKTQRLIMLNVALLGSSSFSLETLCRILVPSGDEMDEVEGDADAYPYHNSLSCLLSVATPEQRVGLLEADIQTLVEEGLVEKASASFLPMTDSYRAAEHHQYAIHHRIRQVAYHHLLRDTNERTALHLLIGRRLNSFMQSSFENGTFLEESLVFNTANQMNLAASLIHDRWELIELVDMNYRASEVAALKHSYFTALKYLSQGVDLLVGRSEGSAGAQQNDPWHDSEESCKLMKKLCDAQCRMQLHCGQVEESLQLAEQIISRGQTFAYKKLVRHTKLLCLIKRQEYTAALEYNLQILELLGHSFPRKCLKILPRKCLKILLMREVVKTRRLLLGRSDMDLMALPVAANGCERSGTWNDVCDFMISLGDIAAICNANINRNNDYMFLAMLRLLQITMTEGRLPATALCFVTWGYLMAQTGDYVSAIRFGNLGLRYARQGQGERCDIRAIIKYHQYIDPWIRPLKDCLNPFSVAVDNLWNNHGSVEQYLMDSVSRLTMSFFAGRPLAKLQAETHRLAELFHDYRIHFPSLLSKKSFASIFQMICSLAGEKSGRETSSVFKDGVFLVHKGDGDIVSWWKSSGNNDALQTYYLCAATVALFFNDYTRAGELCEHMWPENDFGPDFLSPYRVFLKGCVGYLLARSNRSTKCTKKHKKMGEAAWKRFQQWHSEGLANCNHFRLILHALRLVCDPPPATENAMNKVFDDAIHVCAFDEAINLCGQNGYVQFQALTCELAGDYFSSFDRGDGSSSDPLVSLYMVKARGYYREWTCHTKVSQMDFFYKSHPGPESEVLPLTPFSSASEVNRDLR